MRTAEFDYELPPGLIAQEPASERDNSRLLVVDRASNGIEHHRFPAILGFLNPGDVLVLNDSRVIPARLRGQNARTGGRFEILLFQEVALNDWWVMVRPGKRAQPGTIIEFYARNGERGSLRAEVTDTNEAGHRRLQFEVERNILEMIDIYGEMPLPPYINRDQAGPSAEDARRYQTVYAQTPGSVAAPTAGLHFTPELLQRVREQGVQVEFVTLHVGLGTFTPVKAELISEHRMHEEVFTLPARTVSAIETAKSAGKKVVSVGTTTVRVLESVARANGGRLQPGTGATSIFLYPPADFHVVDALLTNFHLPRSTLLMLVSAFAAPGSTAGIGLVRHAYEEAVRERYRFFSYGDAMLIK
jgi:S-adenosylmethionine:tRNA ribosyltransferase-isomerase